MSASSQVAALFVDADRGPYAGLGCDVWGQARDARLYLGTMPVVAHPPCEAWGRFAWRHRAVTGRAPGDDGGCFASALASVRRCGGVLEHPANSRAWEAHRLPRPLPGGLWWGSLLAGGFACDVEQGAYGHEAPKRTWLYVYGAEPLSRPLPPVPRAGRVEFMAAGRRHLTPEPFARWLLDLARGAGVRS